MKILSTIEKELLISYWTEYSNKVRELLVEKEIDKNSVKLIVFYFNKACGLSHKLLCRPIWGDLTSELDLSHLSELCRDECPIYEFCGSGGLDTVNHTSSVRLNKYLRENLDDELNSDKKQLILMMANEVLNSSVILNDVSVKLLRRPIWQL